MLSKTAISLAALVVHSASLVSCAAIPHPRVLVSRQYTASDPYANWPTYDQLPLHPSFPTKAAWGVWGDNDTYGALNHITPSTIFAAAQSEIQRGEAISLNLRLDIPDPPINPTRKPLTHLFQPESGYTDDVLVMNTQISTQFDGLRHFPYSTDNNVSTYQFYNDLISDYENEIIGSAPTTILGIQEAAEKGIAGRGVLLDFAGWAAATNVSYTAFDGYAITIAQLDAVATWQGLDPSDFTQPGDMLFIRTGWTAAYSALSTHEQNVLPYGTGNAIGLLASDDSLEWLWEKKLALVGADNPAFESVPFNGTVSGVPRSLHQVFIGGWGQSIIEFLDFEVLADRLHALGRSTFWVSVQCLDVVSGIASPPNAMAVL